MTDNAHLDRIAEVLARHRGCLKPSGWVFPRPPHKWSCSFRHVDPDQKLSWRQHDQHVAKQILDAIHPVIDTVEQLDALPVGAVVIDDMLDVLSRDNADGGWLMAGYEGLHIPVLPARVLWSPSWSVDGEGARRAVSASVHRLDDYRPFDVGTPSCCYRCSTPEGVRKSLGEAGFVWSCDNCPHPEDV